MIAFDRTGRIVLTKVVGNRRLLSRAAIATKAGEGFHYYPEPMQMTL
ncbi:hypothetical protein ABIB90_002149 [Bradyrhizobium sp. JR4.1]